MMVEVEKFIDWVRMRSPQARTWRDYKSDLGLFRSVVEKQNVEEIQPKDLDHFVMFQVDKGYKPTTINRRLAAVASFYHFLAQNGQTLNCPVLPKRHYLREPQRLPRPLNQENLRKFFDAIPDVRDRAMFNLMLRCGLRIGEVAALQMPDLYLGEALARMIIRGKGARERTVYLSSEAEHQLQEWLKQRPKVDNKHVFLSYQLRKLSTTSINVRINHVREISGVDLTAHRLRHTFADYLLSAGVPITSIQKLMGHRFVETTQTYAVANDRQVQADFYQASEKLEGWRLLLESVQSDITEADFQARIIDSDEPGGMREEPDPPEIRPPEPILRLPNELVRQLEAYRQWKVNRWRSERVIANSISYYSQQGILWAFFCESCSVKGVSDLRLEHVLQFVKTRLEARRSPKTVNSSLSALRSFLSFLKEDGIDVHPSLDKIQRLKQEEVLPRYMSAEQVRLLKEALESNVLQANTIKDQDEALLLRAIFYLLWQGGLRSGEVELLRFSDFYISRASESKRLFVRDGKWRKGRAVYLTDVALDALKAYLRRRGVGSTSDFVFLKDGLPLKKNFLAQRLKTIGKQVDVSVSPHRLRHTFAIQLLNVGCKVTSIQRLLGHTNVNTTMTYARAFDHTVMLDYLRAVDEMEVRPEGAWFELNGSSEIYP